MLSLCMIAKNEQANIARAIESFRGVADEVILVDTGSTDQTVAIAQSMNARIFHEPWCDDFSHSRNAAIAQARGDWIFWLDCDEALAADSHDAVRQAMLDPDAMGFAVIREDITDEQRNAYTEMWQLRLFRNHLASRFQGRCHPQFMPPLESLGQVKPAPQIRLRHWGYLAPLRRAKLERSARLVELELRDRPGQLYYLVELGRTLLLLGDQRGHDVLKQAAGQLDRSQPQPPGTMAAALLEYLVQLPEADLPAGFSSAEVRRLALAWYPRSIPLLMRVARERFSAGDFSQAAEFLQKIRDHSLAGDYDKSISFAPDLMGTGVTLNLAICRVRLGELAKAQSLLEEIATCPTNGAAAKQNLDVVRRLRKQFQV